MYYVFYIEYYTIISFHHIRSELYVISIIHALLLENFTGVGNIGEFSIFFSEIGIRAESLPYTLSFLSNFDSRLQGYSGYEANGNFSSIEVGRTNFFLKVTALTISLSKLQLNESGLGTSFQ